MISIYGYLKMTTTKKDKRESIIETLTVIQKEIFDFKKVEENLILLYQYPTSKVSTFYSRIERLFDMKIDNRPSTLNELVSMIIEATKKDWWK